MKLEAKLKIRNLKIGEKTSADDRIKGRKLCTSGPQVVYKWILLVYKWGSSGYQPEYQLGINWGSTGYKATPSTCPIPL